jgi:hypothetical protein
MRCARWPGASAAALRCITCHVLVTSLCVGVGAQTDSMLHTGGMLGNAAGKFKVVSWELGALGTWA